MKKILLFLFLFVSLSALCNINMIRRHARTVIVSLVSNNEDIYATKSAKRVIQVDDTIKVLLVGGGIKKFHPLSVYTWHYDSSDVTYDDEKE